jgi:hypothetical protein
MPFLPWWHLFQQQGYRLFKLRAGDVPAKYWHQLLFKLRAWKLSSITRPDRLFSLPSRAISA